VIALRKLAKEQGIQELDGFRIEPIIAAGASSALCNTAQKQLLTYSP
jgi:hypothetical protein